MCYNHRGSFFVFGYKRTYECRIREEEMKKILFVASECVPFIKTGGLADVVGSLPQKFNRESYDVRVMIPMYSCIPLDLQKNFSYIDHFYLSLSDWVKDKYVGVFKTILNGITYYLIDNQEYFTCDYPYGDVKRDIERFAFFDKAVLSCLPIIDFKPDVIHCNDWQTGLIPVYLKEQFQAGDFFREIKTLITIHNLKFQGTWNVEYVRAITGLSDNVFTDLKLKFYKDGNLLKGGLVYSDYITTVSQTYAQEIQTKAYGEGLEGLLYSRRLDMQGIINGIDPDYFDPSKDTSLDVNYNWNDFRIQKPKNKKALQKELGLEQQSKKYLIGIVSRLTDQKGLDLICAAIDDMMDEHTQFVVVGTGERKFEEALLYHASRFQGQMAVHIGYSEKLSQRVYAGADALLMPSLFEPCGLSQLIALRYGTIPIVRETGGLKDTVIPFNQYEHSGIGFSFQHYSLEDMLGSIHYSKEVFLHQKREWNHMIERGMKTDYSWNKSKNKYEEIYYYLT